MVDHSGAVVLGDDGVVRVREQRDVLDGVAGQSANQGKGLNLKAVAGTTANEQAAGLATQSVAQSMAIAIQDAADLLRNISTIESTAIGIATAKWIADPVNVAYKEVIQTSQQVIGDTAKTMGEIGKIAAQILTEFPSKGK